MVIFGSDFYDLAGTSLHEVCRQAGDARAVSAELLRWHFRQAVLSNMKGAGEPIFEHDFPPGSDMAAVRKRWRALVAEHHPDRLIARGVSPTFIKVATDRLAAINAAYESIERMRT